MATDSRLSRRKRIAYVITRLIRGGAQKVCLDIVSALKDRYDIMLISGTETGPEGSLWPEFRATGINIKSVPEIVRGIAPLKDFSALLKLYRFFRRWDPDIVHCHTAKAGVLGCVAARLTGRPRIVRLFERSELQPTIPGSPSAVSDKGALQPRIPSSNSLTFKLLEYNSLRSNCRRIIWSPHGHIFAAEAQIPQVTGLAMHIFYWLWKLACSCSDKIIALTNADKQDQVDLKLGPGHKFSVIYNGINIDAQHSAQAPSAQSADLSGHPVIGVIGRLSTEKGQEYLIRAAGILKARYPDIKLLIVGDGAQRSYLASLAEQLNISANVTFTGIVSDVYPLIRRMDIIILPSLYEAFGLVLLEAMAMKKPVIATRVNGVPEIVAEGSTGLLVPPADAGALADAVIKFVDNPDLGRAMGEKGYLRFNQLFSSQQMISQVENLYA